MPRAFQVRNYLQYTGSNKSDVLAMMMLGTSDTIVSVSEAPNGLWRVGDGSGNERVMSPTNYVVVSTGGGLAGTDVHSATEFTNFYTDLPDGLVTPIVGTSAFSTAVASGAASAVRAFGGTRAVGIPAAVSLTPGTRTVAVTWPRALPTAWGSSYDVDISPDVGLLTAPYTYAVTGKTSTGCTLNYTNAALIVSLAAGTVDLTASK